jgi:transcriptional regulator with XRE-family HTH domain
MALMKSKLRLLRERLNFTIEEVSDATGLSFRTILRAEQGSALNPESRRRLCQFYGKTSEELGLVPRRRKRKRSLTVNSART